MMIGRDPQLKFIRPMADYVAIAAKNITEGVFAQRIAAIQAELISNIQPKKKKRKKRH